jgi:hypothetical protein
VNDAIMWFTPNGVIDTYGNNRGSAKVFVKRIVAVGEPFTRPPGIGDWCRRFESPAEP